MTDLVTVGETPLLVSPPGTRLLERSPELAMAPHGTESSVAAAGAAMGAEATWVSKLPETPLGERVTSQLAAHGVESEVTWLPPSAGRVGLTFAERGVTPRSGSTHQDRRNTTGSLLAPADVPMDLVRGAEMVFAGAATATLSDSAWETTEAVLRAAGSAGATTALDIDHQPGLTEADDLGETVRGLFDHLDVLFANEDVARNVLGMTGEPRELGNTIVAQHDFEMVVISRSELGGVVVANFSGPNMVHRRETIETETVDPTGDHAAFVGGFLHRILAGGDPEAALSQAVALGSIARTIEGPLVTADPDQVARVAERVDAAGV